MQISIRKTYLLVGALLLILCASVSSGMASEQPQSDTADDTMLMFVGEADPVVTVASLNPEDPTTAPAIVNVVSREEILRRGYRTLAELLADQPGFFVAAGARGSVPYLRGLRDSILFLYYGVPMTTDVTKSFTGVQVLHGLNFDLRKGEVLVETSVEVQDERVPRIGLSGSVVDGEQSSAATDGADRADGDARRGTAREPRAVGGHLGRGLDSVDDSRQAERFTLKVHGVGEAVGVHDEHILRF